MKRIKESPPEKPRDIANSIAYSFIGLIFVIAVITMILFSREEEMRIEYKSTYITESEKANNSGKRIFIEITKNGKLLNKGKEVFLKQIEEELEFLTMDVHPRYGMITVILSASDQAKINDITKVIDFIQSSKWGSRTQFTIYPEDQINTKTLQGMMSKAMP